MNNANGDIPGGESLDEQLLSWAEKWNPFFDTMLKISKILAIIGGIIGWILSKGSPVIAMILLALILPSKRRKLVILLLGLLGILLVIKEEKEEKNGTSKSAN